MRLLRDDFDRPGEALVAEPFNGVGGAGTAADDEDVDTRRGRVDLDRGGRRFARVGDRLLVCKNVDGRAVRLDLEALERVQRRSVLDVAVRADVCEVGGLVRHSYVSVSDTH